MEKIRQALRNPKLIYDYIQGYTRMYLDRVGLLPRHIKEQVEYRKIVAHKCLKNGSCFGCGCKTPELFYCDKGCSLRKFDEDTRLILANRKTICYTKMKNKDEYKRSMGFNA